MTWLSPWALLGLAAIAVPVAVHLIGRRRPAALRFPTLRFLQQTTLAIRARRRLHDRGLLALRAAIVAAAVAALAGPLVLTGGRRGEGSTLARAIVVDASASMSRRAPDGREALSGARSLAIRLASESASSRAIEATDLRAAVGDAAGWLGSQRGRRELVIISDFQAGAIDRATVAGLPDEYGVRIERIAVQAGDRVEAEPVRVGDMILDVAIEIGATATGVQWTRRSVDPVPFPVAIDDGDAGTDTTRTAIARAAAAIGIPSTPAEREILLTRSSPASGAAHPAPWMFEVIEAAYGTLRGSDDRQRLRFAMPSATKLVAVLDRDTDPASAARVLHALARSAVNRPPVAEFETNVISDAETRSWEREPGPPAEPRADNGASDARWVWALVLLLLGAETIVRQRDPRPDGGSATMATEQRAHDARVA